MQIGNDSDYATENSMNQEDLWEDWGICAWQKSDVK
jgi:hypothetical protein